MSRRAANGMVVDQYGSLRDGPTRRFCRARLWARAIDHGVETSVLASAYNVTIDQINAQVRAWRIANGQAEE